MVSLKINEKHKTSENLRKRGAFTLSIADLPHMEAADFFGIASGNRMPDKFARSGLTLECRVVEDKMEVYRHHIPGEIVGVLADEDVLDEAGNVDAKKLNALVYDQMQGSYYTIGEKAGKAWSVGAGLMKNEE